MTKVLVFSGTTEGKAVSRWLKDNGIDVCVSVATEYGGRDVDSDIQMHYGSYGGVEGISKVLTDEGYELVIDATHPYATTITSHVREACVATGVDLIRVARKNSVVLDSEDITYATDTDEAVEILSKITDRVLLTIGMKELEKFTQIPDYKERVVARVLSVRDSVNKALDLGFEGENLICARGPFSEEFNHATIRHSKATILVTKDTGVEGGLDDKLRAAHRAGIRTLIIRRPDDSGISVEETISVLEGRFGIATGTKTFRRKPSLAIIGIGMGGGTLTQDAVRRIESADLLIGAERMISSVDSFGKDSFREYRPKEVIEYLDNHPEYERPAVLVSGDVGFYSGAKRLIESIDPERYTLEVFCGISSMVYLCSRIGIPWQDIRPVSAHGKDANIIGLSRVERGLFTLLTQSEDATRLCEELVRFGLDHLMVIIGQDLGTRRERIYRGKPSELLGITFSNLCVAIILNDFPDRRVPIGIEDGDFIRGSAPMTKSEIRSLSVIKLKLEHDSIVYDIGAGTGSVSIEIARVVDGGRVYSIEKDSQAVDLIECNKRKFCTPNVSVISGIAPMVFEGLPVPTHAFIGGSSGRLRPIVAKLMELNPDIRIVMNAVTIETVGEISEIISEFGFGHSEILYVSVSKARELGGYHLMAAQNSVHIVTVQR